MSQTIHAKSVIGVRASELITTGHVKVLVPVKGHYDKAGSPIVEEEWLRYSTFQGVNYCGREARLAKLAPFPVVAEDLKDHLESLGLAWVGYDYYNKFEVVGVVAHEHRGEKDGVPLADLPALFAEAAQKLKALGCDTEPKLYSAFLYAV